MGFREQAAAIPRVWSAATAATTAASTPRGEPCRNREMGLAVKILLRIVCRLPTHRPTLRPGKIGNPRETGGKTRLGQISTPSGCTPAILARFLPVSFGSANRYVSLRLLFSRFTLHSTIFPPISHLPCSFSIFFSRDVAIGGDKTFETARFGLG